MSMMRLIQLKDERLNSSIEDECLSFIFIYNLSQSQRMSTFKTKAQQLKAHLSDQLPQESPPQCKAQSQTARHELSLQQPIIIEKKTILKSESQSFKKLKIEEKDTFARRKVQPWVPITVPTRDKKIDIENLPTNAPSPSIGSKEIEIQIEKDDKGKDCLKKLFKKVKKLQQELKESEKEGTRLGLQLQNFKAKNKTCADQQRLIAKLQAQNYKVTVDLDLTRRLLKQREDQVARLMQRAPREIVKQVIIEKPVEVLVDRPVPGPERERVVQRVVEIPKYIQVEKKVPFEVVRQVEKEVVKTVTVEVPTIVERPIYIDKPVYIKEPVERQRIVEVPVEVPVEYPVYIDKPVVQQQFLMRFRQLESDFQLSLRDNALLADQNDQLRKRVAILSENIRVLQVHNEQKNKEVEIMLQNSVDFAMSPQHDYSMGSVKYSISSNPHPRII